MGEMDITGLSFYKCNTGCEYHFAIEYQDFSDLTAPTLCPLCTSDDISFVKDINFK